MRTCLLFLLISALAFIGSPGHAQIINTFAGNGMQGSSGDSGQATAARLDRPLGVAVDDSGNTYIAVSNAIRKVSRTGVITTIAGKATTGYSGDGGLATAATLNEPWGIAVDKNHNIYIADQGNQRVRKISAAGIITTIAGNGTNGFSGDGSLGTLAQLNDPEYVAVDDAGNVYISDVENSRVRKVDMAGVISTFAGSNVYNYSGDGGPATAAGLAGPEGIAVDAAGNILVADGGNACIRKINQLGIINTYPGSAGLSGPMALAVDKAGNVFVNDNSNHVYKISAAGARTPFAGTSLALGDGGPATLAMLATPWGLAVDGADNVYISELGGNRVRKVSGISGATSLCLGASSTLANAIQGGAWYSSSPAVAFIGSVTGGVNSVAMGNDTIYYVTGTDTALSTLAVITAPPGLSVISGPAALCYGITDTLNATVSGGVWSAMNGNVIIDPVVGILMAMNAGMDTILYTNANGCGLDISSFVLTTHGRWAGAVGLIPNPVCADSLVLTDTVSGGVWTSSNPSIATISAMGVVKTVASGFDTVFYSVTDSGCTTALPIPMHTIAPLAINAITTLCAGSADTLTLNDTANNGGVWSAANASATITAAGIVTGVSAGTDTIVYIRTNVCGTDTASFMFTVNGRLAGTITGANIACSASTLLLADTVTGGMWASSDSSVAVMLGADTVQTIIPGYDTITYTITETGCTSTASFPLSVVAHSTISSVSGPSDELCLGSRMTLTDSVAGGAWSVINTNATIDSNGIVTGVTPGTDTILYLSTNGCDTAIAAFTVMVDINEVGNISGLDSVCPTNSVTLTDTTSGGVWASSNPATATISAAGVVTGIAPGYDTITYAVTKSCGTVTVSLPVIVRSYAACGQGVSNTNKTGTISIYPNPSAGTFIIDMPVASGPYSITVYDLYGRVVAAKEYDPNTGKAQMGLHNLPPGSYLLKVQNGAICQSQKIVLK